MFVKPKVRPMSNCLLKTQLAQIVNLCSSVNKYGTGTGNTGYGNRRSNVINDKKQPQKQMYQQRELDPRSLSAAFV